MNGSQSLIVRIRINKWFLGCISRLVGGGDLAYETMQKYYTELKALSLLYRFKSLHHSFSA